MFREENHGNVSGILTLEIWKGKKSGTSKNKSLLTTWILSFPAGRNAKNVHERSALINTLITASYTKSNQRSDGCSDKQLTREIFRKQHNADHFHWNVRCSRVLWSEFRHDLRLGGF